MYTFFISAAIIFFAFINTIFAQKELRYDPEKGIIFDDTSTLKNLVTNGKSNSSVKPETKLTLPSKKTDKSNDIHIGREKDPPEIYYKSGLEYFKNNDFKNAYKNFHYADSVSGDALYKLWKAKCLRRIGKISEMLILLNTITEDFSNSDVADDALLEIAIHYKNTNEYEKALQAFTQLIEQYPFGISSSTGEELPVIAREQRKLIRAEMLNLLSILGIKKEDLSAAYKQFQKENNLNITGTGTKETVDLIKKEHNQLINSQQRAIENDKQMQDNIILTAAAAFSIITLLLVLLILHIKITNKQKQYSECQKALNELNLKKI